MINPCVYITCDKASCEEKGQKNDLLLKMLSWYNPITDDIEDFVTDVDMVGVK